MDRVDCIVIGAGVVGLAIAAKVAEQGIEVLVLEQFDCIGSQTSSRNSEVIHAGIYYPANSLKAELCVRGKALLYEYCQQFSVPHEQCGKIIVAANSAQLETVKAYLQKGKDNHVNDLRWLPAEEVAELEPQVNSVGAVLSPSTGIIDTHAYMLALQGQLESKGGMVVLNTHVTDIDSGGVVRTADFDVAADWVINCAGLQAPELAQSMPESPQAYYAIGHYYSYTGRQPFQRLVYPVAQEGGLGVHVTLDLGGQAKFGPDVRWIDSIDYTFDNSQFDHFVDAIRAYFPAIDPARLQPGYTGIRPKIAPRGSDFRDFVIAGPKTHGVDGQIHLLGIESPGLTSSLAIAESVTSLMRL